MYLEEYNLIFPLEHCSKELYIGHYSGISLGIIGTHISFKKEVCPIKVLMNGHVQTLEYLLHLL